MKTLENPILEAPTAPHSAINFNKIRPEHFIPALNEAIVNAKLKLEKIKTEKFPNFENTIVALEETNEEVNFVYGLFYNLLIANGNKEMHSISDEFMPLMASFSSDISLDIDLFKRVQLVYENLKNTQLDKEDQRLLTDTYQSFTRNGALLDDKSRQELRKIDKEIASLGPQFSQNATQAINEFMLEVTDQGDLSGLPESVIASAKHLAEEKGLPHSWVFTLQMPSYLPFVKYCDNRELRKKMVITMAKTNTDGPWDNRPLIHKILKLKERRAHLLGYENHAQYNLEKRMAETPKQVHKFLNELFDIAKPAATKEIHELQLFVDSIGGPNPIQAWDFEYYSEKYQEKKFGFSPLELKPYFQLENVVNGVFTITSQLFNLEFKPNGDYPVYHPEVHVVEVYEKSGEYLGLLYLDYFPHANKKSGAWMTNYREQGIYRGHPSRPHVSIVCNFTKPTSGHPSLLTLNEVRTLFHEFGHALHSLLSKCKYRNHSGTQVYWDFVELPSQMLENWVEEKESLQIFAKHYQNGETIPDSLIEKIKLLSQFQTGYANLRQIRFATLDMAYHTTPADEIQDVLDFEDEITSPMQVLPKIPGANSSVSFQHIFSGGYSAGYYSYKWAEVLDADAFEFFKQSGIFNANTAKLFKENILERGGSEHPMVLYKSFRGREPDPKALLRRDGLL